MKSVLENRHFHDEAAAYRFVEGKIWPNGLSAPIATAPTALAR
jgi:hypothetical protein